MSIQIGIQIIAQDLHNTHVGKSEIFFSLFYTAVPIFLFSVIILIILDLRLKFSGKSTFNIVHRRRYGSLFTFLGGLLVSGGPPSLNLNTGARMLENTVVLPSVADL
jgi:hypothetical protein